MACCGGGLSRVDGAAPGAGAAAQWAGTVYELDFSAQPNLTIVSGANTIDGISTWLGRINATDTLSIVNGSGLQYVASANSSTFNASTQTATYLMVPLSELYAQLSCDSRAFLQCEIYASALNLTGTAALHYDLFGFSGTPTGSGSRLVGAGRAIAAATQVWKTFSGSSAGFNYAAATCDTWGFMSDPGSGAVRGFAASAAWGGDWPTSMTAYDLTMNAESSDTFDPIRNPDTYLAIAGPVNTLGTTTWTVERIRVSAWQPQQPT